MIPWDYNLAFGTFQGNNASSAVNDPIDTPLSVTGSGDRPIIDWIFSSEKYIELYHQYFAEFLNSTDFATIIDTTVGLIAPYVEKDPTAFYSYKEFELGIAALQEFCRLRAESIQGQVDGTIPSTDESQTADTMALIDASTLNLSDMGSMFGGGMRQSGNFGNMFGGRGDRTNQFAGNEPETDDSNIDDEQPQGIPDGEKNPPDGFQMPGNERNAQNEDDMMPDFNGRGNFSGEMQVPDQGNEQNGMRGGRRGEEQPMFGRENQDWRQDGMAAETSAISPDTLILVGVSVLLLLAGILIAVRMKH